MMRGKSPRLLLLVLAGASGLSTAGGTWLRAAPGAQAAPQAPPSQVPVPSGSEDILRVFVGKSIVVNSPDPFKRVSVTDDTVASALVVSPNQLLIHGLKPGSVTLLVWGEQEQ